MTTVALYRGADMYSYCIHRCNATLFQSLRVRYLWHSLQSLV